MATRTCPICGKDAAAQYRPFCSKRCADVDLSRWLGDGYRIPTEEPAVIEGGRSPGDEPEDG